MKVQAEVIFGKLFEEWSGQKPDNIHAIAASGSPRKYFRITSGNTSVIGAFNPDLKENEAFLALTKHFHAKGLPVPELLASDNKAGIYLISDLGDNILFDEVIGRPELDEIPGELKKRLSKVIRTLPHFQIEGARGLDWSVCYPRSSFDLQSMMWDLNYFKYYILKTAGITFNEQLLEDDFRHFADFLMQAGHEHFMYRDFQSRNVMFKDGNPFFIDYQGGRKGPLQYDLASFLYQVKAHYPESIRKVLINEYINELGQLTDIDRDQFFKFFYPIVYLRLFQVLGAYGFRGLFEKRPHFRESLGPALKSLSELLILHPLKPELPELQSALHKLAHDSTLLPAHHKKSALTVSISSFSYKKGLPEDSSGHGGGFIFDCRALPNPGRLEAYKTLTGRDHTVISYLERYREVDSFLHNVFELCDGAVDNYLARAFSNLSISFGCTGGQHRSVYCADRLAEHLSKKYNITIGLQHREQNISETRPG